MPTYEYACKACGERLEVVQSFEDDPLTTCPACGGQLRKVFGAIGIAFKGSGFYRTDSRPREKAEAGGDGAKSEPKEPAAGAKEGAKASSGDESSTSKGSGSQSSSAASS